MQLEISIHSHNGQLPDSRRTKTYDSYPVFIGRSTSCHYVLHDPSRYISSNHAVIHQEGDQLLIEDTSQNGVYVNGSDAEIGRNNRYPIKDGDTLEIGEFTLVVAVPNNKDAHAFLEPSAINAEYNPFKDKEPDWYGGSDDSWLPNMDDTIEQPQIEDASDIQSGHYRELDVPPAIFKAQPSRSSGHAQPDDSDSLSVLLEAIGVNEDDFSGMDQRELAKRIGLLLSQSVDGIMSLLESRQEMKSTIRSNITTLSSRHNNPLKFSANSHEALDKLLLKTRNTSYLSAEAAITQAVEDLKIHQLATLEAMSAAVESIVAKFDPEQLENKLGKNNQFAAAIPVQREAKLWGLFEERFQAIHEESVSDFDELFSTEIRKAYEKHSQRLSSNRNASRNDLG